MAGFSPLILEIVAQNYKEKYPCLLHEDTKIYKYRNGYCRRFGEIHYVKAWYPPCGRYTKYDAYIDDADVTMFKLCRLCKKMNELCKSS